MGKFDGILLCTDLDDTLLTSDKRVSRENYDAIEYFKSEGGLFTFATGRVPLGTKPILRQITPNAPAVCFNGASIYDFGKKKTLWSRTLDEGAINAVEYIDKTLPDVGIEICTEEKAYFCKVNDIVLDHQKFEEFPDNFVGYRDIPEDWIKVLFMTESENMEVLRNAVDSSPFSDDYTFVRSSPWYYELLPKGADKGSGLCRLGQILGIAHERIIAVGDNENDLSLIKAAGIGVAVANAVESVRAAASYVTREDCNSNAIAAVIRATESGSLGI